MASRYRFRTEADKRMAEYIARIPYVPALDLGEVSRGNLDRWVRELRDRETAIRKFRQRLEALQAGSERACPQCGRPVAGRADAVYCGSLCRIRAHRASRVATGAAVTTQEDQ